jgi:hypothetical protein
MKKLTMLLIFFLGISFLDAYALSMTLTGGPFQRDFRDPMMWFIFPGDTLPDEYVPYLAFYYPDSQQIKATYRDSTLWDSLYFTFIPGDRFWAYMLGQVNWSQEHQALEYEYTLITEQISLVPIMMVDIEKKVDCIEMYGPKGYIASDNLGEGYEWSNFRKEDLVSPGGRLSGMGIRCTCPPVLGWLKVRGVPKELENTITDSWALSEAEGAMSVHQEVESKTIVPGPCPERIEPVDWVMRVALGIYDFIDYGYLDDQEVYTIYPILSSLAAALRDSANQNLDSLEVRVNETLTQLEPAVAPPVDDEARGYIMENLRYILRNPDKVRFKRYRY